MKYLTRPAVFSSLLLLNGCTILGAVLDNRIEGDDHSHTQAQPGKHLPPHDDDASFASIGLDVDIAFIKKMQQAIFPSKAEPKLRCAMENGFRICYQEDAEGY